MRTDAVTGRAVVIDRDRSRRQGGSTRLLAPMGLTLTLTLPLPLPLTLPLTLVLALAPSLPRRVDLAAIREETYISPISPLYFP